MNARQAGSTLVELLVGAALGLVVLGAVLGTVVSSGTSARRIDDMARLADDGNLAIALLSAQLRMAGYSMPRTLTSGQAAGNYSGIAVRGCDSGFEAYTAPSAMALVCADAGKAAPAAFSVLYEADTTNTYPGTAGEPTNCLGNKIVATPSPMGGDYYLADNRFFVRTYPDTGNPALYCGAASGASFTSQPLVDNVEGLVLTWGLTDGQADALGNVAYAGDSLRYVTAAQLDAAFSGEPDRWRRVASVRICVTLRTAAGVAAEPTGHVGCDGKRVAPVADRRLRRVFQATVQLRNRSLPA